MEFDISMESFHETSDLIFGLSRRKHVFGRSLTFYGAMPLSWPKFYEDDTRLPSSPCTSLCG